MNICPHCGAKLRDNARFCPACMTSLVNKQVIPTPKYNLQRWLSVTVAVFVLLAAVGAVWMMPSRPEDTPVTAVMDTTTAGTSSATTGKNTAATSAESITETGTNAEGTTLTTPAESFSTNPTDNTTAMDAVTTTTTGTTGKNTATLKTTQATTTTKKTTTTTTTTPPTYPEEWDTVYRSTTEDNLPIEEVTWTYKPAGEELSFSYRKAGVIGLTGDFSRKYTQTIRYDIPMSQCIILTGFDAPTSNGIYRIPAAIDGKVVVGVDMSTAVTGACQFNDADIAPTVKRLYLPPELLVIQTSTIDQCTALEGIYFGSDTIWIEPDALPVLPDQYLYMYSYTYCYMSCTPTTSDPPILKDYCTYKGDDGLDRGKYGYYKNTRWRLSSFAWLELYGYRW